MVLSGADVIVQTLVEQGCDTVFGMMGGNGFALGEALAREDGIRLIRTMRELGAVHAADGYARATGRTGVVVAPAGAATTDLVSGLAAASLDSVALVVITSNVATALIGTDAFQEVDITGVTLPIVKHSYFAADAADLPRILREAFFLAQDGRPGPVLVDVPADVAQATCEFSCEPADAPSRAEMPIHGDLAAAAAIVGASQRPCIYVGGGAVTSSATDELLALAKAIDAPIVCSMTGISAIPADTQGFLGMQGVNGRFAANEALSHADCVIACGVRFSNTCTAAGDGLAEGTRIVHIDVDPSELSKVVPADCAICGDIKDVLATLAGMIVPAEHADWQQEVARLRSRENNEFVDVRPGFTPRNVLLALNRRLSPATPVLTGVGSHQVLAAQTIRRSQPRTFVTCAGLDEAGFGMGAAVGAALGCGQRCVLVENDGGLAVSFPEMVLAAQQGAPVVIVAFDAAESPDALDCVALAGVAGIPGTRVTSLEELRGAFDAAFSAAGPYLIDCALDAAECAPAPVAASPKEGR